MTAVLNIVIPILAGICILATLVFFIQALVARTRTTKEAYGVGQQEARHAMQLNLIRAVALIILSLILLGIFGLSPRPDEEILPILTNTPSATTMPTTQPTATNVIQPTTAVTLEPTEAPTIIIPNSPTPIPVVATPTPIPTDTAVPPPQTVTVSSGVGVWLRATPSVTGEQLEWLLDGTTLTILPGIQQADELEWQQVRTETGVEGWVAAPFIIYNE